MQASKFADVQRAFVIKQGDEGEPVAEVCLPTFIAWPCS